MSRFRALSEIELARLGDDELVAYALEARAAGEQAAATLALRIFTFGMQRALLNFVRNRLDSHGDAAIEEVAERALESAIRSIASLRGKTAEEARALVFRIARRRIADFLRSARGDAGPGEPIEGIGGEPAPSGAPQLVIEGEADGADTGILIEELIASLRPDHRAVVELFVLDGYSARETVDLLRGRVDGRGDDSMTEQNVHQIASRFRRELRARLEAGGEEPSIR